MFLFDLFTQYRYAGWAPLPLRLIVGFGFMEHGFAKLSKGPDAFATILHAMGVPAPHLMAWVTIFTEIGGGFAVILGGLVPVVAVPMAVVLLVAVFTVHLPYGFSSIKLIAVTPAGAQFGPPGYECDLLYLVCLTTLVMTGPGPLALDEFLGIARPKVELKADARLTPMPNLSRTLVPPRKEKSLEQNPPLHKNGETSCETIRRAKATARILGTFPNGTA